MSAEDDFEWHRFRYWDGYDESGRPLYIDRVSAIHVTRPPGICMSSAEIAARVIRDVARTDLRGSKNVVEVLEHAKKLLSVDPALLEQSCRFEQSKYFALENRREESPESQARLQELNARRARESE